MNNLDESTTSSLSTSTGLSSSHSTVDSIRNNRDATRDLASPPMNSTLLDKESMVANFGDSKVGNTLSESSFPSLESGSFTPKTNAEDSGIDDRSGSLEKMRLESGEEYPVKLDGPVAVSSPADASTPVRESQGDEKKSLTSSLLSDQNENEVSFKESENEGDSDAKEQSSEMTKEEGNG